MKVLICSDTHGRHDNYVKAVEKEKPFELLIHCGDVEGEEDLIRETAGCEAKIVAGNCDYYWGMQEDILMELGGKQVLITHGHNYYVAMTMSFLEQQAAAKGVEAVIFGHTHCPMIEEGNILCMNPGSLSQPRQMNQKPSYIVLEIDENGYWNPEIRYL